MDTRATASIIIIGEEILKGQTKDTNSHFLCQELYKCGIHVTRISVISDNTDAIAEEVMSHSKLYTYVFTSGGIGPTHDDVTYEGIAKAFSEHLILNKELHKMLSQLFRKLNLDESAMFKMSRVPETAEVHYTGSTSIPIVSIRNVFIFPGIPFYLELAFRKLKSIFKSSTFKPYCNTSLYINVTEFHIVDVLNAAVDEFEHTVKFGSYPYIDNDYFEVKLVLEADSNDALIEAEAYLRSHLPQNTVVGQYHPKSEHAINAMLDMCHRKNTSFNKSFSQNLRKSLDILEQSFKDYSLPEVCVSFNGGKDCTVLLHLTYLFLYHNNLLNNMKLKVFYVKSKQPFPEIEDFIEQSIQRYDLQVLSYEQPIKEALSNLKDNHSEIKAILMGCRLTDPNCTTLQSFQNTDSDWPQFMRVNPLSHWSYADVWNFLRELEIPYCSLYDKGYTSLGCQHNTVPNELLLKSTKDGGSYYLPAYLLKDIEQERKGRASKNYSS